ncbi:MAG TPA: FtsX-like permease family protein, partial [Geobacteraceae bacterium]|nr:FtsX-like permease family protein [Geobacteraceae bacterium]
FAFPEGQATDLAVTVGNPRELTTIAAKIARQFPDTRPILKSEILRTYDSIFDWRGGMVVVILSVAILSFVIFAWDKATGLSAEERKEIGILKSIGWETGDVLLLKFWEGTVISLSAFLVGVILAYGHLFFFSASLFEHALKGWAVLYPRFRLTPAVDSYQLAVLFFLTVVPYAVATVIPSWRAATADPDAAMRS